MTRRLSIPEWATLIASIAVCATVALLTEAWKRRPMRSFRTHARYEDRLTDVIGVLS